MIKPIPLSVLTLYADLAQRVETASRDEATVVATTVGKIRYLRLQRWIGTRRVIEHLGRADDPAVIARADTATREMGQRRERRTLVAALRRLIPGPTTKLGQVLDAVAAAGLFERGAVLVGTAAYQCYAPLVGAALPVAALMTQDVDLATADLALSGDEAGEGMQAILQRADPTFAPVPGLDGRRPPTRFRSGDGFLVDLLAPRPRRTDANPMPPPGFQAGAVPMQQLDWLITEPVNAVVLHGAGVLVRVPQPARYAVHKLIVAQKRDAADVPKGRKDLLQAQALIEALRQSAPFALEDALADARRRGRDGWSKPVARSLEEIERF